MNENKKNEVILIGLPNSGKSTLINSLTNSKSSIVGSEPNTTRDKISTYFISSSIWFRTNNRTFSV